MNNSKRSFLAITVIATAALAAAITLAIVWVVSTYKDRQEEFAATVKSALNKARQKEMDDHFSASEHNGITVTVIGTDSAAYVPKGHTFTQCEAHGIDYCLQT